MIKTISPQAATAANVVYMVRIFVGSHRKQFHYIGYTTQPLVKRFQQHLYGKSAVHDFIKENLDTVKEVSIEVIKQAQYKQELDALETIALCEYILKRGTKANQKNRLVNKSYKYLNEFTLQSVKACKEKLLNMSTEM